MIDINIKFRSMNLTNDEVNLASGSNARNILLNEFLDRISSKPSFYNFKSLCVHESVISMMVGKYSEQIVYQPLQEIRHWFAYSSGAYIEPGYPPLFYSRVKNKKVSPNKSAVAGIGEGVAGLIAQRLYRCRKIARPNHDYPDIVMSGGDTIYLVESKATITQSCATLIETLDRELARFATLLDAYNGLDKKTVKGLLVGTNIVSENKYDIYLNEVTV